MIQTVTNQNEMLEVSVFNIPDGGHVICRQTDMMKPISSLVFYFFKWLPPPTPHSQKKHLGIKMTAHIVTKLISQISRHYAY
jgi:hypothetical protein